MRDKVGRGGHGHAEGPTDTGSDDDRACGAANAACAGRNDQAVDDERKVDRQREKIPTRQPTFTPSCEPVIKPPIAAYSFKEVVNDKNTISG